MEPTQRTGGRVSDSGDRVNSCLFLEGEKCIDRTLPKGDSETMTAPHSQTLSTDEDLSRARLTKLANRRQPRPDWQTKQENLISDKGWVRWIRQMFHDDRNGMWVFFSLNTRYPLPVLMNKFEERCWLVAKEFFDLNRTDQNARVRKCGLCTILIPATSASRTRHYHGLIRLPRHHANGSMEWVRMKISENNQETYISVPRCLRQLLVRFDPVNRTGNLRERIS